MLQKYFQNKKNHHTHLYSYNIQPLTTNTIQCKTNNYKKNRQQTHMQNTSIIESKHFCNIFVLYSCIYKKYFVNILQFTILSFYLQQEFKIIFKLLT